MKSASEKRRIAGRNSVREAIESGNVRCIYCRQPLRGDLVDIVDRARRKGIKVKEVDAQELDRLSPGVRHQGIVAELPEFVYADLQDVVAKAKEAEQSFLVLVDGVEDPHNLGAIIRTAECAGAAAVVVPAHRNVGVTEVVHKTSAGAAEWLPIVRIGNISQTLDKLKEAGFWVAGADMHGEQSYLQADWRGHIVLVVGNEGKGMSRLTKEKCDFLVQIPMYGQVSSLNVSVAAGLMMYAIASVQRS